MLIAGFSIAAALQPASYSPVQDTISALAARGAADPWVMTLSLVGVGICYVLTAVGLRPAHRYGRISLAGGGVATLLVATFQQPPRGYSVSRGRRRSALRNDVCVAGTRGTPKAPRPAVDASGKFGSSSNHLRACDVVRARAPRPRPRTR